MSYYLNYKGNYWDRKVFNTQENFDLNLLKYSELSENISEQLFKKYVELVCLEMSYYCNRACNYCPVHDLERSDKDLEIPEDIFVSVLNSLNKIDYKERISLNLFNEPLASKNFLKNVSRIKQKVPKAILSLSSSGDYIKSLDDLKKLDNCGVNEIVFTMHTPKNKPWNREYCEEQMKRFAKKIQFTLGENNIKNLNFSFLAGKLHVTVYCTDWNKFGNSRGGLIKKLQPEKNRINPCEKPIREFVISYDGTVQLCCHSYHNKSYSEHVISKIDPKNSNTIFKIYACESLTLARKNLFDYSEKKGMCATCNHYEDHLELKPNFFHNPKDKLKRERILKSLNK